jgi:DNA-binding response OmpR family regulator
MRCLLVEDEPAVVAIVLPELERIFGTGNVEVAEDRDTAIGRVGAKVCDLIVLDQRIPTAPGQLDPDVIHGRAVLSAVREKAPDTPVYFLTGLPMENDYVDQLIAEGRQCDVWGDHKPIGLIQRFQKATLRPFYEAAAEIAKTARVTDDIEINTKGAGIQLNEAEARLLRCFARRQNGVCVDIQVLSDGLSGVSVVRADVKDAQGGVRISAASKLGDYNMIAREMLNYEQEIVRLPAGTYAPVVSGEIARVAGRMGAFYRLLSGHDRSLFQVLQVSDADGAACVRMLQHTEEPWFTSRITRKMPIGDLAKLVVREDRLHAAHAQLGSIDWQRFEDREISVNMCTRHGDLHGENARVDINNRVMLIDYGSVRPLPSALEAVTLELSPFFHPHGPRHLLQWATATGNIDWFDREAFCALSLVPEYIRAARTWAHAEAFGDREVLACGYIYVLWQLGLPVTDRDLAIAVTAGIVARGMP